MNTEEKLGELIKLESTIENQLTETRTEITEQRLLLVKEKFGISIGSIVLDGKGKEHRVTKIGIWSSGLPWITGNPKKKDGTFGTAHRNLYGDWKVKI